ncbi:zinc-ribbon domain-containing protein [Ochrobactrum chromiisoli]|uniref:Zinc ribbon domain-containing protein n=1 Tax=Ochrobactrum chromiisoli TaxID=2993941 RepID=A0ABT3QL83_9HYPH|nr:hypothetical protein [Ochrobactrum chromiisoli]MCX2696361.1 hypothetical protein [Ochrobactrum chromiisoli]
MTEYDPRDDSRKSYDVAVEAKRKRGDTHWPERLTPPEAKPFWLRCGSCDHEWIGLHTPMEMSEFSRRLASITCPSCGADKNIFHIPAPEAQSNGE